jgi:hypothetical protein
MDAQEQLALAGQRAEAARRLLENPTMKEALDSLEKAYIQQFRLSGGSQVEAREDAYFMLRALDELKRHLAATVQGGKVAAFNLRSRLRDN